MEQPVRIVCGGNNGNNITIARLTGTKLRVTRSTKYDDPKLIVDNATLVQEDMAASVWPAMRQAKHGARLQIGGVKGKSPTGTDAAILMGDSQKKIWLHEINGVSTIEVIPMDATLLLTMIKNEHVKQQISAGQQITYEGYIDVDLKYSEQDFRSAGAQ